MTEKLYKTINWSDISLKALKIKLANLHSVFVDLVGVAVIFFSLDKSSSRTCQLNRNDL